MNMVTKNAHRQAMAADSVAVKMPERIPPRMMTTVISPHRASRAIRMASRKGMGSPLGKLRFLAKYRHMPIIVAPRKSPGMTPATKSAAIDTEPPAASE
jgi:hypothetical protein